MIFNGFLLGFLTFIGWATVWHKMPLSVRQWTAKHSFIVDLLTTVCTYLVLGSTIVALFAAAWVGLLFEMYMYIQHHQEDFTWLWDGIAFIKTALNKFAEAMRERNKAYKEAYPG